MKRLIPFIALFFIFNNNPLNAQTDRGTWLLGGSLSYQTSNNLGFLIANPSLGYFLVQNVAGGAQFTLFAGKSSSSWSLGPFAKYYFYGNEKGRYYASVGLNIGSGIGSKFDTGWGLGAGYALFLNKSISVDLGANYTRTGSNKGVFNLGAGFQIHFNSLD